MKKSTKADTVETLRGVISAQKGAVVAEYRGLTVGEATILRKKLRQADAEFRVVKNTLIRLAAKETGFARLEKMFTGPTAVAFTHGDPVALAKVMKDFAGGSPKVRIKAGYLDGKVLSAKEVEMLAEVPSRDVLLGRLAGGLVSPLTRLVRAMSGTQQKLAYALQSIHDLKINQKTA